MANVAEYFEKNRYHGSYDLGERVFGYYNKIPFIGSVGNDSVVSMEEGPRITVLLDLPIIVDGQIKNVIIVKHKDIKSLLVDYDAPVADRKARASKTPGSGFDSHQAHQEQPGSHRRTRSRKDRYCRRSVSQDCGWRSAPYTAGQTSGDHGHGLTCCRHQVPRRLRAASEGRAQAAEGPAERDSLHRRDTHADRCRRRIGRHARRI